ncbi:dTDP-L-rhamnose 4-epimerase [Kitasatospora sp. MAP12-15]|uniref:NAD-dependent epimerase/dehydratase family protein n=1 Tax=unclassified Kitasatospora TaxID=2633591 RepID=UPI002475D98D|nr:NAD-dependent epimerase/dehydratase family protein [Kitasatospora sp. MAP12-44]MDH6114886.1 dTDP-L-rhamnose 4-epimerase [Kitasatospora sp. MAP12-44]
MDILLTGGAGFIGSAIAARLVAAGHRVRVLDALLPAVHPDGRAGVTLPTEVEFVHGDVRDPATVRRALDGVDAVCHQAAMVGLGLDFDDAPEYVSCNELGTAVLLAAMARGGVRQLVLAGSMVVYGEGRYTCAAHGPVAPGPRLASELDAGRFEPPCPHCAAPLLPGLVGEEAPADPRNVYAAGKLAQEHLAAAWARACGGRVTTLRYHNVYGPGMPRDTPYAGVASLFRSALAAGRPPRVFEDGGQRRDFVHVSDVAAANEAALAAVALSPEGTVRTFNTGSGSVHTVGEMATALATAFGGPAPVVTGEYRLGDVRHITADSQRLRAELGWRPTVPFAAGMAEFAAAPLRGARTYLDHR